MIYWNSALDFLKIVLIWPVALFVIFFFLRKNISKFIDEISELDWGGRKVKRKDKQESIEEIKDSPASQSGSEWDWKKLFLDQFLKPNSLHALKWFYINPGEHSASEFANKFILIQPTPRNEIEEKDAIILALRETKMVDIRKNLYKISEEGTEYLKYKGLI